MAEYSTPEQRTEMPTPKRMSELRKKGQIHMSNEIPIVATILMGFIVIMYTWQYLMNDLSLIIIKSFKMIADPELLTGKDLISGFKGILRIIGPELAIIFLIIAATAVLSVFLQTNWNIKEKKLDIQFSKLNPVNGLKRVFSIQGLTNLVKAILKLIVILPVSYLSLKAFAPEMVALIHTSVHSILSYTGSAISQLFWDIIKVLGLIAIADYFWTKHRWLLLNKMTKQEVKDEKKAEEGDEQTRKTIQQKGLQRIRQRILSSVPQADVVITNPTHYAVALKYDRNTMPAPMVLAKGKGFLAKKIREIARKHSIPILERKPLARALYHTAEVGKVIPYELYRAVAEVIAYVMNLRNPKSFTNDQI